MNRNRLSSVDQADESLLECLQRFQTLAQANTSKSNENGSKVTKLVTGRQKMYVLQSVRDGGNFGGPDR